MVLESKDRCSLATSAKIGHNFFTGNLFLAPYYRKMGDGLGRQNRI